MLPLIWEPEAEDDLGRITAYIAEHNPEAAKRIRNLIAQAAELLPINPLLYRPGRVSGIRELVAHPNYILIYCVQLEAIRVLAVFHSRRQYP